MKSLKFLIWGLSFLISLQGAALRASDIAKGVVEWGQKEQLDLREWSGEVREKMWVYLALYEQGTPESIRRANTSLDAMLASPPTVPSRIAAQPLLYSMFTATTYVMLVDHYLAKMPPALQSKALGRLREIIDYTAVTWEPKRLNDEEIGHTNYALMWLHAYIRGSEILKDPGNMAKAYKAFHQWCDYTLNGGINEFNATTYYKIDMWALGEIAERSLEPEVRRRARAFNDLFWLDTSIHYWPAQNRTTGAMARTYSLVGQGGTLDAIHSQLLGDPIRVTLGDEIMNVVADYRPPALFKEIALNKRKMIFEGRWQESEIQGWRRGHETGGGDGAFGSRYGCDRYTYIEPRYSLGTGGDGYAWQDRMLAADFAGTGKKLAPIGIQINTLLPLHSNEPFMNFIGKMRHWPFRSALVQKENVAMMLCTMDVPHARARAKIIAPLLLFPSNVDHIYIDREPARRNEGLHALNAQNILFLEEGDVYAALRFIATGEGFHGYQPTYWYRVDGNAQGHKFGALIATLYDGPIPRPIGKNVRIGFVLEMGTRDQFKTIQAFQSHVIGRTRITQSFKAGIWEVGFDEPATSLRIKRDVVNARTLDKTVDGHRVSPSVFQSTLSEYRDGIVTVHWDNESYSIDLNRRDHPAAIIIKP